MSETKPPVPRLCCFCQNVRQSSDGSESMGSWDTMGCYKGHFPEEVISLPLSFEEMRRAHLCPDYKEIEA